LSPVPLDLINLLRKLCGESVGDAGYDVHKYTSRVPCLSSKAGSTSLAPRHLSLQGVMGGTGEKGRGKDLRTSLVANHRGVAHSPSNPQTLPSSQILTLSQPLNSGYSSGQAMLNVCEIRGFPVTCAAHLCQHSISAVLVEVWVKLVPHAGSGAGI
jgi:hypothetical protein